MTECEIAGSNPSRINAYSPFAQKCLILYSLYSYYVGPAVRARRSVLHRGTASLLPDQWPVDGGHPVLGVTTGRHRVQESGWSAAAAAEIRIPRTRRPESEKLPRVSP